MRAEGAHFSVLSVPLWGTLFSPSRQALESFAQAGEE